MTTDPPLSISIVVHNQAAIAHLLLDDIATLGNQLSAEVLFTVNKAESLPFDPLDDRFSLKIIQNESPKGFGANHNFAFKQSRGRYFCVLNPDIRLVGNPFDALIACLNKTNAGVVAPRIVNPNGEIENSARRFPTPFSILNKTLTKPSGLDYPQSARVFEPDWVGGMFMLFTRSCFEGIHGFDERYFLYYEDVDLCARMKLANLPVFVCSEAKAVHDGRGDSHHNLKYMLWHLRSMMRFFVSKGFWKLAMLPRLRG